MTNKRNLKTQHEINIRATSDLDQWLTGFLDKCEKSSETALAKVNYMYFFLDCWKHGDVKNNDIVSNVARLGKAGQRLLMEYAVLGAVMVRKGITDRYVEKHGPSKTSGEKDLFDLLDEDDDFDEIGIIE